MPIKHPFGKSKAYAGDKLTIKTYGPSDVIVIFD